jgi:hypothetical protein
MRLLPVLPVIAAASVAIADPGAEALFREGRDLLKSGKLEDACDRFARSEAIEPKVGTALNLGDCREHQGLFADAWEAFVAAQSLASRDSDDRRAEAGRRAAALEPRLAHLQITAMTRPPGLAITRNGRRIELAALDSELPVDPGSYEVVATAPGYKTTSARVQLAVGGHATAALPALDVDPAAVRAVAPGPVIDPPLGRISIGAAFGGTSDSDIVGGVRVVGNYPVPHGAVRATFQALYTPLGTNDMDPYHHVNLYGMTVGFDYLFPWARSLASAAGLGVGMDVKDDNYSGTSTSTWAAVRASPIVVRFPRPNLEVGLHGMYVVGAKVVVGVLGVDWFVW